MGSITNLTNSYLQSTLNTLNTALQSAGLTNNTTGSTSASTASTPSDSQHLSPFAQLLSMLQELQQSNPSKYQQVTQQIATNLQDAAQTAQSEGNTTAANQLSQLSTDFSNASTSGQLPNIQDLAQAVGGGHHHGHGHHSHAASSDSDSASSSSSASTSSVVPGSTAGTSQTANQLLSAFQSNTTPSDSLNPLSIILNTLASAGIGDSNS